MEVVKYRYMIVYITIYCCKYNYMCIAKFSYTQTEDSFKES